MRNEGSPNAQTQARQLSEESVRNATFDLIGMRIQAGAATSLLQPCEDYVNLIGFVGQQVFVITLHTF